MAKSNEKYGKLIRSIKRKKVAIIISIFVLFIGACTLLDSVWMTLFAVIPLYAVELFLLAAAIMPLSTSLNIECDPEKYLILNEAAGNRIQRLIARATGNFYLGEFDRSLAAAEEMIASRRTDMHFSGLFNKARALFFLGRAEEARAVVRQFGEEISTSQKLKEKHIAAYNKLGAVLNLMVAISERDEGGIKRFRVEVSPWNEGKPTTGFVCYMKALAAFHLNDRDESVHGFMSAKEMCEKTFLAKYAEQYLKELRRADGE